MFYSCRHTHEWNHGIGVPPLSVPQYRAVASANKRVVIGRTNVDRDHKRSPRLGPPPPQPTSLRNLRSLDL